LQLVSSKVKKIRERLPPDSLKSKTILPHPLAPSPKREGEFICRGAHQNKN